MLRIIYVSVAGDYVDSDSVLQDIVDKSKSRNCAANVTGALIYTGSYFAQAIEGPTEEVRVIYESIRQDVRHSRLKLIENKQVDKRLFDSWNLAYSGLATYISKPIRQSFEGSETNSGFCNKITKLMLEFTKSRRDSF